ncbi:MAG: 4-(cytidine 5'-diphospho)-2-C-methyl-D-erythritol kinase [Pseudomonadota bacterium]
MTGLHPVLQETARAKVNLTLEILGKRPDGYHALESLVAFADIGDVLTLDPGLPPGVSVSGPFGETIVGENIVVRALGLLQARHPDLNVGAVHVQKRLPVAAGLGGGSANAAAVLRCVKRLNPEQSQNVDFMTLAAELGADVPVCLLDHAAWMRGIGERLETIDDLPPVPVVLANPQVPVPADKTVRVFKALDAPPYAAAPRCPPVVMPSELTRDWRSLVEYLYKTGNGLYRPAHSVIPQIDDVLGRLSVEPKCAYAAVSGAGPTCFAVFPAIADCERAADAIQAAEPNWWVVSTVLR